MPQRSRAQRLNGLFPLSYTGVVPVSPVNFVMDDRAPTVNDSKNFYIGDLWLDTSSLPDVAPKVDNLWMLVSLSRNDATWVNFGAGNLESLSGNTGTNPVFPDVNDNINVIGDGITINVSGDGANTLTVSAIAGTPSINTLTGDNSVPVPPLAGNINILGTAGNITVLGNAGTHTLTIDTGGDVASSFITNPATGTAIPVAGALTFAGAGGIAVAASGHTVTISNSGTPAPMVGFGAYKSVDTPNATGDGTFFQVICDGVIYDLDSNYNGATGTFTAPTDGTYHFDTYIAAHNITTQNLGSIFLVTTARSFETDLQSPVNDKQADNILHYQMSVDTLMSAGDTASLQISLSGAAKTVGITGAIPPGSPIATYFNGHRLDPAASFITGAETFITDAGTATPNILGQVTVKAGLASLNSGSSVEFTGSSNNIQLNVTDASNNTIIGKSSGNLTLTSTNCTVLGTGCGSGLTTGATNIFIGVDCGSAITTGGNNLIIGDASVATNLTGTATSDGFIGIGSGNGIFIHNFSGNGGGNVFVGYDSGSFDAGQSGSNLDNTAIGQHTLRLITTGTSNSCVGYQAGSALTTGSTNTLIGRDAGIAYTGAESNNICIGIQGIAGESNKTKIGGIRGATTTNNDAVAVLIDSAGQLGTVSSSMRYKSNIEPMGSVSDRLMNLEPVTFSWKEDQNYHQQLGLIAEEVEQVFPELVVHDKEGLPETVKYHELPVLLLNELKKLSARVAELEKLLT